VTIRYCQRIVEANAANMKRNTFANNVTVGGSTAINNRMIALEHNIENLRMGRLKLGSDKWLRKATQVAVKLGYQDMIGIEIRDGKPWFVARSQSMLRQLWIESAKANPKKKRRGEAPKHSPRVQRVIGKLMDCPRENVAFLTVVTTIAVTKEDTLHQVKTDGAKLDRFIRKRFPHAVWLMLPEVDAYQAKKISVDLVLDNSWRKGVQPNTLVYKVHFHGIIYVPGISPSKVEAMFKGYKNGKRVKHYAGNNQVRALKMNTEPGSNSNQPDCQGVVGYATKRHYRPPTTHRMLEGFVDWVWITNKLASNDKYTVIGGVAGPIHEYCPTCDLYHPSMPKCECEPVIEYDDFFDEDIGSPNNSSEDDSFGMDSECISDQASYLNCAASTDCTKKQKTHMRKNLITVLIGLLKRMISSFTRHKGGP